MTTPIFPSDQAPAEIASAWPQANLVATVTAGDKIVYPSQGPCLIGPMVVKLIDDAPVSFVQLILLNDGGGELFVPVSKLSSVGIRRLLEVSEVPKLFDRLREPAKIPDTWRERKLNNGRLLASGSADDLSQVVESLTDAGEYKSLSFGEGKVLEKAKKLLVCEVAEVMGFSREEAERQIDGALDARREVTRNATGSKKKSPRRSNDPANSSGAEQSAVMNPDSPSVEVGVVEVGVAALVI